LDPRHLVQLAEIIDQGSLTQAAKSLGVPQATLSRNMAALEAVVGAPVLERGRRGARPTEIGRILSREGRRIRVSIQEASTQHRQWSSGLEGRLRIGVGTLLAHSLMPKFLVHPLARSWNVALRIEVEPAERLLARLKEQELDVVLTQMDPVLVHSGLVIERIFDETIGFFAGETHPLAARSAVTMAELSACRFVSAGTFANEIEEAFSASAMVAPIGRFEFFGDVAIALHLLTTGDYVAAMPSFLMRHLCDGRRFVQLPVPYASAPRTVAFSVQQVFEGHPLIRNFQKRFRAFVAEVSAIP
jgi:molybdate transport repressor ModE-like protein